MRRCHGNGLNPKIDNQNISPFSTVPMLVKCPRGNHLRWLPIVFLSARVLISKISRWRKLSNSTPKSRAGSRSKMPTNMASKLLKFGYRKCCVDRLRFQNICWLNRRPYLSLLGVKENYTRHAGVSVHVICSIATIIEWGHARWYITKHICSPSLALFVD